MNQARFYQLAADGLLVVHALFILFVVGGLVAILLGLKLRRSWARNFWFRVLHLGAIGLVVMQAWLGWLCPLTVWENTLRRRAGQLSYEGSFVEFWLHRIIFYEAEPWVFTTAYSVFGLGVALVWLLAPPRLGRRSRAANGNG